MSLRILQYAVAVLLLAAPAHAVTVAEIIELSKAGLPDEVLTAVIDADRTIFTLDAAQIVELKKVGISRMVLLKMLHSRQEFEPKADAPPATSGDVQQTPGVVVIGASRSPDPPQQISIVVPYYVPVPMIWGRLVVPVPTHRADSTFLSYQYRGFGRFINDGWIGPNPPGYPSR